MADTPTGETVTPEAPSNNATPPATPVVNADAAEVERLRKEAEQARMRANQLENELAKRKADEEAAKLKQLEEQNEWKTIAEQNAAKLEAIQQEREEAERQTAIRTATSDVLKDYSQDVIELAEDAGLALVDDSEEAKAAFKQKLDKISAKVSASVRPATNNPGAPQQNNQQLSSDEMKVALRDEKKFHDLVSQLPTVARQIPKR